MLKKIAVAALGIALLILPTFASAEDVQSKIAVLLAQIKQLQALITQLQGMQGGYACVDLSANMGPDDTDADARGQVTKLQNFLAQDSSIYTGPITGYFGPATTKAVQRWQSAHSLITSGEPDSTGFGYVGPKTRAAMACAVIATSPSAPAPLAVPLVSVTGTDQSYVYVSYKNFPASTGVDVLGYPDGKSYQNGWDADATPSGGSGIARVFLGTAGLSSGTYYLRVYNKADGSNIAKSDPFTVKQSDTTAYIKPSIVLKVDPVTIQVGQSATISWQVVNAAYCSLYTGDVQLIKDRSTDFSSSTSVSPTQTTTYTMNCTSASNMTTLQSVTLGVATATLKAVPPTITLAVNGQDNLIVPVGTEFDLTWNSKNASSCVMTNAAGVVNVAVANSGGSSPGAARNGTIAYKFSCQNTAGQSVTKVVTVTGQ